MRFLVSAFLIGFGLPLAGSAHAQICNPCIDDGTEVERQRREYERRLEQRSGELLENPIFEPPPRQMPTVPMLRRSDLNSLLQLRGLSSDRLMLSGDLDRLVLSVDEQLQQFDEIYEYVSDRTGLTLSRRIRVNFESPDPANTGFGCPQRGTANAIGNLPATRNVIAGVWDIRIFAGPDTSAEQLRGVLAHEIAHVLMVTQEPGMADFPGTAMHEGFATWAAGQYTIDWYGIPSLQAAAAQLVRNGAFVPLNEPVGPYYTVPADPDATAPEDSECLARRDRLYTQWGGFVDYLVQRRGVEALLALLGSRSSAAGDRAGTPETLWGRLDYEGIYGLGLPALQQDWLDSLAAAADPVSGR